MLCMISSAGLVLFSTLLSSIMHFLSCLFFSGLALYSQSYEGECTQATDVISVGKRNPKLKDFRRKEIRAHNSKKSGGIWVTYNEGVYDITDFLEGHPGKISALAQFHFYLIHVQRLCSVLSTLCCSFLVSV